MARLPLGLVVAFVLAAPGCDDEGGPSTPADAGGAGAGDTGGGGRDATHEPPDAGGGDDVSQPPADVPPAGASLRVSVEYAGPGIPGAVDVVALAAGQPCPAGGTLPEDGALADGRAEPPALATTLGGLDADSTVTLVAVGVVDVGGVVRPALSGCRTDVRTPAAGQWVDVVLPVRFLPLTLAGAWDVVSTYELTDGLPPTVDAALERTGTVLAGVPGRVAARLAALAGPAVPGDAQERDRAVEWAIERLEADVLVAMEPGAARRAWLEAFEGVAADVNEALSHLTVQSVWTLDSDGLAVTGDSAWASLSLPWGGEDRPFAGEALVRTAYPLSVVAGALEGAIGGGDRLVIHEHALALEAGRLVLFVLDELALPEVADGARTFEEALGAALGCEALAATLAPGGAWDDCLPDWGGEGCLSVGEAAVAEECAAAVVAEAASVAAALSTVVAESEVRRGGNALLVEETGDLAVDRIEQGRWTGMIRIDGIPGGQVLGTWEATRRPPE